MNKKIILHPFLFSIFAVLSLFSYNITETLFSDIIFPLIIVTVFALTLLVIFRFINKDITKASVSATVFLFFFYSYGPISGVIHISDKIEIIFLIFWILILIPILIFIKKASKNFDTISKNLNIFSALLIVISTISITFSQIKIGSIPIMEKDKKTIKAFNPDNSKKLPDIYYFIFDRYGSKKTLKDIYNYDNSEFLAFLSKKGFYVADKSLANYPGTLLSLTTSLNMRYLNEIYEKTGKYGFKKALIPMLQSHKVQEYLKSLGYFFIHS